MSEDDDLRAALIKSADRLNRASNTLSDSVAVIETNLKQLNIGLCVWVPFDDDGDQYELGYAKIGNRWCLAIAERDDAGEEWAFSDAPRVLRLSAVAHIPTLLAAIAANANKVADEVETKTALVRSIPV